MLFAQKCLHFIKCDSVYGYVVVCSHFVCTSKVGVSSRNVVSRTFPHFSQSMLTPMAVTTSKSRPAAAVGREFVLCRSLSDTNGKWRPYPRQDTLTSCRPSLAAILMYDELYVQVGRASPGCRRRWYHWLRFRDYKLLQTLVILQLFPRPVASNGWLVRSIIY